MVKLAGVLDVLNPVYVGIALVLMFIIFVVAMAKRYIKVGLNEALIISGGRRGVRVVKGGGTFVWPIVEEAQYLLLEIITINIKTPEINTVTGVPIILEAVAQIKVGGDEISIRTAAEQFLSKSLDDMKRVMLQTLEGHLRSIVGTMTVEDIYKNREEFSQRVQDVAATDLAKMGLHVISFALQHITDERGYLDALGKPRTAQVIRDATIGEAVAQSEATQRKAQAEQAAKEAEYAAQAKIAEAKRNFEVKQAEFVANVAQKQAEFQIAVNQRKAEQDLAYQIQQAQTAQSLKQQEIKTAELEAQRKEVELSATIIKPVEADRKRIQTLADAQKYKLLTEAEGQANATKSIGVGEAEARRAKGIAEADVVLATGQSEAQAMSKKASAWKEYNEAAIAQTIIEKMPEIVKAISEPLSKTDKITIVSTGGDGLGASKVTRDVTNIVAQLPPIIEALSGIDLKQLVQAIPKLAQQKDGSGGKQDKGK